MDFASEFSAQVFVIDVFSVTAKAGSLVNITEKVAAGSKERLREAIGKVDAKNATIKIASYNGDIVNGLKGIDRELCIDLIILAPRSNDIKDELYLGDTSGKIIKKTNIPSLIVPKGTVFKPFKTVLTTFKSGVLKKKRILNPLISIREKFKAIVSLLLVKTPGYKSDDLKVHPALIDISEQLTVIENATTYQGVLENLQSQRPDLLCVFRRKRGFFKKLWEKNTILKSEFFVKIPVLILRVKKD